MQISLERNRGAMIVGRITGQSLAAADWDQAADQWASTHADHAPLSALLIEMGGALYDDTCWRRWLFQLLIHVGLQSSYETFYRLWDVDYYSKVCRGERDFWPSLGSYLRSCGMSHGICDEVIVAARARRRDLEDEVRPMPGVRATLSRLNAVGVSLIAVSNSSCPVQGLKDRLAAMRIDHLFQLVVSSRDLGCTMPDRRFFETTLTRSHLSAEDAGFVSRNGEHLQGARSAHLLSVAVNHDARVQADIRLDGFSQLCHAIPYRTAHRQAG
jgi:FMN phosphatase YigB (HAD superfamily)